MDGIIPGRLGSPYGLVPLKRISPSRFIGLQQCALREVWRAADCPPLLPRSPRAWVGTIIHEMLQMAAIGRFNGSSQAEIGVAWESKVEEAERRMLTSWLDAISVPLSSSVWDLHVQRIRTINQLALLAWSEASQMGQGGYASSSAEMWIEAADHSVGGFVDSVVETNQELLLRDFKSGLVNVYGSEDREIKPEYIAQLELYCGLFFEAKGRWADGLEIVPVAGEPVRLHVDRAKCLALVQSAKVLFHQINNAIASPADVMQRSLELATVSPDGCSRCEYRPGCVAYKSKNEFGEGAGWPVDVIGTVGEIGSFANGSSAVTVDTVVGVKRVRGLTALPSRHPALSSLVLGSHVGLYNLKATRGSFELTQGPVTTIYVEQPIDLGH